MNGRILLCTAICACIISCSKPVTYPETPVITYKNFIPFGTDSAHLQVQFTDGSGEVGYLGNAADARPNFYIEYLRDSAGAFVPIIANASIVEFTYLIPSLTPSGKNKAISGEIQINVENWAETLNAGDTLEFKVWLFDRLGNRSNIITTPRVIVP